MRTDPNPQAPINLGNPGEFTINELAVIVQEMIPQAKETIKRPLPEDDPQRRRPDIARAKALLGWEPRIPLRAGLEDTISWFRLGQKEQRITAA